MRRLDVVLKIQLLDDLSLLLEESVVLTIAIV